MMTPSFTCSQNEQSVIVTLYVPAVRASDVEIHAEDTFLTVHINPYFLRLTFPGRVLEDDASDAKYDPSSGYLTITLTKETRGEVFKDLDILAKLLAPHKRREEEEPRGPVIEVIKSEESGDIDEDESEVEKSMREGIEHLNLERREIIEAAENDWQLPQSVPESIESTFQTSTERRYGFLDMYAGYFRHVAHTENEVNELGSDVESMLESERRERRLKHEDEKWDEEYYMADYADDEYIQELIAHEKAQDREDTFQFTEEENQAMMRLPQKEYLPTPQQVHNLYLILITILFSNSYDTRTTQDEPTSESAWTTCSLTPAFSALDPPPYTLESYLSPSTSPSSNASTSHLQFTKGELSQTLTPSIRRSLAFPLYRNIQLVEKCVRDVSDLLRRGRRAVLRALLKMKRIIELHDVYYIYSKIWLEDFCVWVTRYASEDVLKSLGDQLKGFKVDKARIGWDIVALEEAVDDQRNERESDSDDD